ncbi:hypothetical protein DFP94_103242 [Fontibacillus phaseoli]|uniref:Uncharacterized protein n=1 Tax=Fontibacillus phaseoli TaxID=1416533 RepID=A0A369BGH3_9BACL|nr:DUF6157 family protein [Fontibacillus phaseoli]RCX20511.1 hypothetical protein DFP94_103242 [Fontibacillus phaseoli]
MSYKNTFILVSPDCPAVKGIVPVSTKGNMPVHLIQYELLTEHPYSYDYPELLLETHIRHKQISAEELSRRGQEIRDELFAKKHACLRASALPKKFGWGVHYDDDGRIAIYAMDSPEYKSFADSADTGIQLLLGMRSRKA